MLRAALLALFAVVGLTSAEPVQVITSAKQFDEAIASIKGTVVVDFHAEWCGPCKQVGPVLEAAAKENAGKITLLKIDVDQNEELAKRFGISSIPAIYTFKDGKKTGEQVGFGGKDAVLKFIGAQ